MKQGINATVGRQAVRFPVYEFLILFLPVAILVMVVGFSYASLRTDARIETVLDDDNTRLQHIAGFIGAQVTGSLNQVLAVSAESVTKRALDAPDSPALRALEASFLTLARRNPHYHQIRWIDETGQERVRVSRDEAEPFVVPREDLQNKADRYYFKAADRLLPGELYISPVDLNVEHGEIEVPYRPVLRIATPAVDGQRTPHGMIIVNIGIKHVFDAIERLQPVGLNGGYLLLNRDGHVLNGRDYFVQVTENGDADESFAVSHEDIWRRIRAKEAGSTEADNGLWTWNRLSPADVLRNMRQSFPGHAGGIDQLISDHFELTLLAHRPVSFLLEIRRDSRMLVSLGVLLGLSIYGLSMYLYLSGHVRERRAELQTGYAVARAESAEQRKRLEERFHRLFEASSVGQLVVDVEGRIGLANAAAERLLHYSPGKLNGLAVDSLVPDGQREHHADLRAQYLRSPEARKMGEGRELLAVASDGANIPVEIGLNPYLDEGRQLVLVTIIDLSNRRPAGAAVQ